MKTNRIASMIAMALLLGFQFSLAPASAWGNGEGIPKILYHVSDVSISENGKYGKFHVEGETTFGLGGSYFLRAYYLDLRRNRFIRPKKITARIGKSDERIKELLGPKTEPLLDMIKERITIWDEKFSLYDEIKVTVFETFGRVDGKGDNEYMAKFKHQGKNFRLNLKIRDYRAAFCRGVKTKIFTLTRSSGGQTKVLQKDKKLYKSRGCPYRYGFGYFSSFYDGVYIRGGSLMAFIWSFSNFDEGKKSIGLTKPLVVSGTLYFK